MHTDEDISICKKKKKTKENKQRKRCPVEGDVNTGVAAVTVWRGQLVSEAALRPADR